MSAKLITIDGVPQEVVTCATRVMRVEDALYLVQEGESLKEVFVKDAKLANGTSLDGLSVSIESERSKVIRERFGSREDAVGAGALSKAQIIKAPMPGLVRAINVSVGEMVKKNSTLLVLEAMKMENNIHASTAGKIQKIFVETGSSVDKNAQLIEISPE